jgi:hypothetical protein
MFGGEHDTAEKGGEHDTAERGGVKIIPDSTSVY